MKTDNFYNNENYKVKFFVSMPRLVSFGPDDVDLDYDEWEFIIGLNKLDIGALNRAFAVYIRHSLGDGYFTMNDLDKEVSKPPMYMVFKLDHDVHLHHETKVPEGTIIEFTVLDTNIPYKINDEDRDALINL